MRNFQVMALIALFHLGSSTAALATAYYVSPQGKDSNNGLTAATPWQTLAEVNAASFQPGDSINLDAGHGAFAGCLTLDGYQVHSTVAQPLVIQPYNGTIWSIYSNCGALGNTETAAITIDSVQGLTIQNGYLNGNSSAAPTSHAIFVRSYDARVTNGAAGLLFQNLETVDFNTTSTTFYSAHFMISGINRGIAGITIQNVKMHGLVPTSTDDNGISGYGNGENITGVKYLDNQIYNIGGRVGVLKNAGTIGNGIWVNGTAPAGALTLGSGAQVAGNYIHDISANVSGCGGTVGIGVYSSSGAWIYGNEVARVTPTTWVSSNCDYAGIDIDGASQDTLVEANYVHHNAGPGWEIAPVAQPWTSNIFRNNISVDDGSYGGTATSFIPPKSGFFASHNNTIYVGLNQTNGNFVNCYTTGYGATWAPGSGIIANNICINLTNQWGGWTNFNSDLWQTNTNPSALTILHNDYQALNGWGYLFGPWLVGTSNNYYWSLAAFSQASGKESGSLALAPQLTAPGTEPTCFGQGASCLAAYEVKVGAPVIGTGINLSQAPYNLPIPSTDFFGHPFTLWNMGADGSAPLGAPMIGLDMNPTVTSLATFYYVNAPANCQIALISTTTGKVISVMAIAAGSHAATTISVSGVANGTYAFQMKNLSTGASYAQSPNFTVN